jgi:hypothetical protein
MIASTVRSMIHGRPVARGGGVVARLMGSIRCAVLSGVPAWAVTYSIADLGTLGGIGSSVDVLNGNVLNASGQVTGTPVRRAMPGVMPFSTAAAR